LIGGLGGVSFENGAFRPQQSMIIYEEGEAAAEST